jgi:hypothetical protein
MDDLIGISAGRIIFSQRDQFLCHSARLFPQLAPSGVFRRFRFAIQFSGRNLCEHFKKRIAELPFQQDLSTVSYGDDTYSANVPDVFPNSCITVGEFHIVTVKIEDFSFINALRSNLFFLQFHLM